MSVVVALGSFNLVGLDHLHALAAANRGAKRLVIAVADDDLVERRTGSAPHGSVDDRVELLSAFFPDAHVAAAADDRVDALIAQFGADALAVSIEHADRTDLLANAGVRLMAVETATGTSALRNRSDEVLWLPRCG
ncbi:MAG: hypothetical protein GX868_16240 [Actinobacteria bacterium]|nr:hypothetical protein [Actinomycetota bacterium]